MSFVETITKNAAGDVVVIFKDGQSQVIPHAISTYSFNDAGDIIATGTVTINTLTAGSTTVPGQAVVTNASKALISLVYTNVNTANTIVARDASGNFAAGTITATTFSGNHSGGSGAFTTLSASSTITFSAQTASTVLVLNASSQVTTVAYGAANGASQIVQRDGSGNFAAGTITAALSGNASTATSFAAPMVGDVTGNQSATTVATVSGVTAAIVRAGAVLANAALTAESSGYGIKCRTTSNYVSFAFSSSTIIPFVDASQASTSGIGLSVGDLNSNGTVQGNSFFTNGNCRVGGQVTGAGTGGSPEIRAHSGNSISFNYTGSTVDIYVDASNIKTFIIDHPTKPDRYLAHSCLEGPEFGGVYYRGQARLVDGVAKIDLPDYFEALTKAENRTVQLTCINGWTNLYASEVKDGAFGVRCYGGDSDWSQEFHWMVMAERKGNIQVEPLRSDVDVYGDGPYKYYKNR